MAEERTEHGDLTDRALVLRRLRCRSRLLGRGLLLCGWLLLCGRLLRRLLSGSGSSLLRC